MNICLSVFVSICFCLVIFIALFLPVYSFGLPCHFSVLYFVSFYLCIALSCTNEKMTDVGVGWEMEPVIYFPVFCRACLELDSPRPQTTRPESLPRVHSEIWTHRYNTMYCIHTYAQHAQTIHTHPAATDRMMFSGVPESGSKNNTL